MKRLIVGISGASGAVYGVRLLEVLRGTEGIETHLVLTQEVFTFRVELGEWGLAGVVLTG